MNQEVISCTEALARAEARLATAREHASKYALGRDWYTQPTTPQDPADAEYASAYRAVIRTRLDLEYASR